MKSTTFFSSLLVAALGIVMATPASAQPYTFTWVGDSDATGDDWRETPNWDLDNGNYPQAGDTAIIASVSGGNKPPVINDQDEVVLTLNIKHGGKLTVRGQTLTISGSAGLDIESGVLNDGLLDISTGGTVILSGGGTHPIGGDLLLSSNTSILKISAAMTFGPNNTVYGSVKGEHNDAKIDIAGVVLTNNIVVEGNMTVREESGTATFVNGATGIVRANGNPDISGNPEILKFASGLTYDDADTGSPKCEAMTDSEAVLQFDTGASCLDGDFEIANCAKLKLDGADIKTRGSVTKTAGEIVLANSATLSENCNAGCSTCDNVSAGFFGGCS